MIRNFLFIVGFAVILALSAAASVWAADSAPQRKPKLCLREQCRGERRQSEGARHVQ